MLKNVKRVFKIFWKYFYKIIIVRENFYITYFLTNV